MIKYNSQTHRDLVDMRQAAEFADNDQTMRAIDHLLRVFGDHDVWDDMYLNKGVYLNEEEAHPPMLDYPEAG